MHDRERQLAYCQEHMVPIWKRWTNGNRAARRLIDCARQDLASHDGLFNHLVAATFALQRQGIDPAVRAALVAATACCTAYVDAPDPRFEAACMRAIVADQVARDAGAG
jgi:hypothetical protein